jgi:hypothetical protein
VVQLLPGTTAATAIAVLEEASRTAKNILGVGGSPIEKLNAYRPWSSQQIRALSEQLTPAAIDQVIATPRYWVLQSIDPVAYGAPALTDLIDLELNACINALESAVDGVRARLGDWGRFGWRPDSGQPGNPAIILDTNVLLQHVHELLTIDWNAGVSVRRGVSLSLGVPMTVVEELDRLKLSTGTMRIDGEDVPRRTLAKRALNWLDETFPDRHFSNLIRSGAIVDGQPTSDLHAVLMVDDLRRDRLARPDLDILDDAIGLRPFVASVAVATYDRALTFRARSLELDAFRPTPEE